MATTYQEKFVTRDQVFRITLSGLMPFTIHYVYIDGRIIDGAYIKPVGGNFGYPKTDRNGQMSFDYYYAGSTLLDVTPYAEAQKYEASIAAPKRIVVGNVYKAVLDANYQSTYLSYGSTVINVNITRSQETVTPATIYEYVETHPVITIWIPKSDGGGRGGRSGEGGMGF